MGNPLKGRLKQIYLTKCLPFAFSAAHPSLPRPRHGGSCAAKVFFDLCYIYFTGFIAYALQGQTLGLAEVLTFFMYVPLGIHKSFSVLARCTSNKQSIPWDDDCKPLQMLRARSLDVQIWYGVPAHASDALEEACKDAMPHLFAAAPDLLYQLVTMLSPRQLQVCA